MKLRFLVLCLGLLGGISIESKADQAKPIVYVWDFSTRDLVYNSLTWSLTDEFNTALVNSGIYSVQDRRSTALLREQADKEATINDEKDIPEKTKSALHLESADMVIFGDIYDDVKGGVYTVSVRFQDLKTGEERLIREVNIEHGKIDDQPTRQAAMEELVKKIVQGNQPVLKDEVHSFLVEITKCSGQGEDVTVELQVTDTDDLDRIFGLKVNGNNGTCLLFDNNGYQSNSKYGKVSNQEGNGVVQSLLISGIPVKCALEFGGVPAHATTISRLFINMTGGGQNFNLTFKNIPIER